MIKELLLELVTEDELPLVKVIGSSLLFKNFNDIDVVVYDKDFCFNLKIRAHRLGKGNLFHILCMSKNHWENIKDLSSFNNICLEWYNGKISYSDHFTSSRILERNYVKNGPFFTPGIIQKEKEKLLKRGYLEKNKKEETSNEL